MSVFKQFQVMAEQEAQVTGDLSKGSAGGGANKVLDDGQYYGYLFHYADIGNQEVVFKGESKGFHPHFKYGVALFDWNQDKGDYELVRLHYEMWAMPIFSGARSKFMKMMTGLATKEKTAPHPVGYLGDTKLFSVTKTECGKYNNVDMTNIQAGMDIRTRQPIPLPDIEADRVTAFLWNNPSVEMFNRLNDYTKNEILQASNYENSKVQRMIEDAGNSIEMPKEREESEKSDDEKATEAVAKVTQETKPVEQQPKVEPAKPKVDLSAAPLMMPTAADDVPFDVGEEV